MLHLQQTKVTTEQSWFPWGFVTPERRHSDAQEAATEVRGAVECVVRAWGETDQSILLELSGGLDSSIVGACLRSTQARVVCSTLVTPVPGADERRYANLIAEYLGVELQTEHLSFEAAGFDFTLPLQLLSPRIGPLQHAVDEAMGAAGDRHEVASFYSGAGGDTVFSYLPTAAPAADAIKECGLAAGLAAIGDLSKLHQCTVWKAGRLTLLKLLRSPKSPYKADYSFLAPSTQNSAPDLHPWFVAPSGAFAGDRERIFELVTTQVYRDGQTRGLSRQLRMPLLSQPVVEACLRVPSWMWIQGGNNRAIARSAFADMLPPEVLNRRSKGTFSSYLGAVYRRSKNEIRDYLLMGRLQEHGLLDTRSLEQFFERSLPPRDRSFTRMFELCRVENWLRHQP